MPTASTRPLPDGATEVRIHDAGGYGSEWQWGCVVAPREPGSTVAWITLAPHAPTSEQRREARRIVRELGFTHAQWERRRGGQTYMTREFRL